MTADFAAARIAVPGPTWIEASLRANEGRDPLGLQTTTQDRLMPLLLPGILELSRRARYFSFHSFLLAEYRTRRQQPDGKALSAFIKHREWEYGLAVLRCPRDCGSTPVGAQKLAGVARGGGPFPRGESVESAYGGYGLYYRSPLAELGIVAKAGTMLGGEPIPIDVLYDTDRARALAATFREAVRETEYYQRYMWTTGDLPAAVVDEFAEVACLCLLPKLPEELVAVHEALFGVDPPSSAAAVGADRGDGQAVGAGNPEPDPVTAAGVIQRRRSVGHYLTLVDASPDVVLAEGAYREALWQPPPSRSDGHAVVAGQWAGLIAKDVWQEAICSVWSEFCRAGIAWTRDFGHGLTWEQTRGLGQGLVDGPPGLEATTRTASLIAQMAAGRFRLPDVSRDVTQLPLEELRGHTVRLDTAASGLVVLLELARRMEGRSGAGWKQAAHAESSWQPSVAAVASGLRVHLAGDPTVADTLWWLVSGFVLPVHERIAYSKLPDFTFRFRWEDGLLRFYDHGVGRFPLAAIRYEPLASLTLDLGMWGETGDADRPLALTERGLAFVSEALA